MTSPRLADALRVVAAVILDHRDHVLLSLRPQHVAHGGLWEFPGGKLERGEHPLAGLAREIDEELGIAIATARPLLRLRHRYPQRWVDLDVYETRDWRGEPQGREGQRIEWVPRAELVAREFPAANVAIVTALSLPRLILVTPDAGDDASAFLRGLEQCVAAGVRLVQLRQRASGAALHELARAALAICRRHGARMMLNGGIDDWERTHVDGLHLNGTRLRACATRPVPREVLLSASCHDLHELRLAERLGVDFVYVSPVLATSSHPGAPWLGWPRLRALARHARVPVFALGGLAPDDAGRAVRSGCQGVAMIGGLWESDDITRAVARAASSLEAEQRKCC